jgi:GGDEF domain-containing protein
LIPDDPKDPGLTRADGVRQAIGNQPIQWKDQTIDLTVSIGLAVYPLHAEQEDDLLTRAEKALEISRKSGGNRVTLWSENL